MKKIYLAGGCFWGVEHYLKQIRGVITTKVGYANGTKENPTYEEVCQKSYHFAEAVEVGYDPEILSLATLLSAFYKIIDPTTLNQQGNDKGEQYRTGIYFVEEKDLEIIGPSIIALQDYYDHKIMVEVLPLTNFYDGEDYHQNYLEKNSGGYCHVDLKMFEYARTVNREYVKLPQEQLKTILTPLQYEVTQNKATERPYDNEYDHHFEAGIYVDIVTKEPLFSSKDKFDSGCGWPAFSKPIAPEKVFEVKDMKHGMIRQEALSKQALSHLGHVFDDGPKELGGKRYCINSAALEFVPLDQMEVLGYGHLIDLIKHKK